MNRLVTVGTRRDPSGISGLAEHCTQDRKTSQAPFHLGVGSKNGYRHHQLGRPAFTLMLGKSLVLWQVDERK
jgi:hypothetical protein